MTQSSDHQVEIISINGADFVAGLFWQTMKNAQTYEQEAKEFGKRNGWDVVTIRHTRLVTQAGFAPKGAVPLKGKFSLAAALAQVLGDNWIAAFEVDAIAGKYAFAAVLDGAIMPGREFVADRDTVEQRLRETHSLVEGQGKRWATIIAPPEFEFGGEHLTLAGVLSPKKINKSARLTALTFGMTRREVFRYAGMVAALLFIGAVGLLVRQHLAQKAEEERMAKMRKQLAALQAAGNPKPIVRQPMHDWAVKPPAIQLAKACDDGNNYPLSINGWLFAKSECNGGTATATYARPDEGTTAKEWLDEAHARFPGAVVSIGNDFATGTVTTQIAQPAASDDTLLPDAIAKLRFLTQMQTLGVSAALNEAPASTDKTDPNVAPPTWRHYTFAIDTKLSPVIVLAGLELDGLRVSKVDVQLTDGDVPELTYHTEGDLYVR